MNHSFINKLDVIKYTSHIGIGDSEHTGNLSKTNWTYFNRSLSRTKYFNCKMFGQSLKYMNNNYKKFETIARIHLCFGKRMLSKLVFLFPYLKIILIYRKKIISSFNFFQRPILTSLSSAENKIMEFKNIVLYSLSSILFDEINDMSYVLTQLLSIW